MMDRAADLLSGVRWIRVLVAAIAATVTYVVLVVLVTVVPTVAMAASRSPSEDGIESTQPWAGLILAGC